MMGRPDSVPVPIGISLRATGSHAVCSTTARSTAGAEIGTTSSPETPTASGYRDIDVYDFHPCAINAGGEPECWGTFGGSALTTYLTNNGGLTGPFTSRRRLQQPVCHRRRRRNPV